MKQQRQQKPSWTLMSLYLTLAVLHGPSSELSGLPRNTATHSQTMGFLMVQMVKNSPAVQKPRFDPWVRKIPCRREWLPTPVFLPGEFQGQRCLVGCSPWGHEESDTTEWPALPLHSDHNIYHIFFPHSNLRHWTQESESCEGETLLEKHLKFKPLEKIGSWLCDTSGEFKYFKA